MGGKVLVGQRAAFASDGGDHGAPDRSSIIGVLPAGGDRPESARQGGVPEALAGARRAAVLQEILPTRTLELRAAPLHWCPDHSATG